MLRRLFFRIIIHLLLSASWTSCLFSHNMRWQKRQCHSNLPWMTASLQSSTQSSVHLNYTIKDYDSDTNLEETFNSIVMRRYACTRFQRYLEPSTQTQATSSSSSSSSSPLASISNPDIVQKALESVDYARRSPSGFNAQPYQIIIVHNRKEKQALSQYCLGRNADRVRDSDCTVIFLADKEITRRWKQFGQFLKIDNPGFNTRRRRRSSSSMTKEPSQQQDIQKVDKKLVQQSILKVQALVLLFSSGWPLPRIVGVSISFIIRLVISCISVITRRRILVPSLSTSETWAIKNTMLVAMTFMLGCTARGLASCPMEGFNIGGIRKVLHIPKRFTIPLIVSVGLPYTSSSTTIEEENDDDKDDAGMSHAPAVGNNKNHTVAAATPRYPLEEIVFDSVYGNSILNMTRSTFG